MGGALGHNAMPANVDNIEMPLTIRFMLKLRERYSVDKSCSVLHEVYFAIAVVKQKIRH